MLDARPDTIAAVYNKAIIASDYDFLDQRPKLVALRKTDLEFTKVDALKEIISKAIID